VAPRPPRRRSRRRERGATLVEYALLASLFVVVSLGAINALADGLSSQAVDVEAGIANPPTLVPDADAATSTTLAFPSTTTSTTAAPTTTSTTAAPTTTSSTTTSTSTSTTSTSTTSTTAAPTTTTTAPPTTGGSTATGSGTNLGNGYWQASGTFTVRNNLNQPVANAVVTIRYRVCSGSYCGGWDTMQLPATNGSGQVAAGVPLPNTVTRIETQVTNIQMPQGSGLSWNGQQTNLNINKP
jgi:Flp pilus assembly pilin Flp